MTTCTASIDKTSQDAVVYSTVLASLPNSYRLVDGEAEVVLASSVDAAHVERLCRSGARAVLIDQPGRLSSEDLDAMAEAADRRGCLVVPAPLYGPRFAAAQDLLGNTAIDLLHSTINGDNFARHWSSSCRCCATSSARWRRSGPCTPRHPTTRSMQR